LTPGKNDCPPPNSCEWRDNPGAVPNDGVASQQLDRPYLPPPGTARSGTPFGVRVLVGLCSGGTAARNPRLTLCHHSGVPGTGIGRFSCVCGEFQLSLPETDRPEGLSPRCGTGLACCRWTPSALCIHAIESFGRCPVRKMVEPLHSFPETDRPEGLSPRCGIGF